VRLDDTDDGFGHAHLPWGSCLLPGADAPALCTRVGDRVVDVAGAARAGLVPAWLAGPSVDVLLARRAADWGSARVAVHQLVVGDVPDRLVHDLADVVELLPFTVADYVDFYASEAHATNVGRLFRPDDDPLPAHWKHLPMGYHGRSGTVVVSSTDVVRPHGIRGADDVGPSERLDVELELGWVVGGPPTRLGRPVPIDAVEDHVLGVLLLDDWSARDLQAFEYRPLGPFLGKSFATSVAAWVTPMEALQDARVAPPAQRDPVPPDHLQGVADFGLDLDLELALSTPRMRAQGLHPHVVSRANAGRGLYWTIAQQLAHLTSNGATLRPGDLGGTGTISEVGEASAGSLLELSHDGSVPLELPTGERRTFLEDGDEAVLRGRSTDGSVTLAPVVGRVAPRA